MAYFRDFLSKMGKADAALRKVFRQNSVLRHGRWHFAAGAWLGGRVSRHDPDLARRGGPQAVLRPDPELVRSRRRRAHLSAAQTAPHPRFDPAQPFDDHPRRARRSDRGGARDHRHDRFAARSRQPALPADAAQWRRARRARTFPARPHRVPGRLQSAVGRDRAPPPPSRDGADRRLHDRFPDGLCRAAVRAGSSARPRRRASAAASAILIAARSTGASIPSSRSARTAARPSCARSGSSRSKSCRWGSRSANSVPTKRDPRLRRRLGLADDQPLLIYVGRLDGEKKPDVVVDAFRRLPEGARRASWSCLARARSRARSRRWAMTASSCRAMSASRAELAGWLASADIYASGMADETFGISIIEAQASGLPVVGVAAGR